MASDLELYKNLYDKEFAYRRTIYNQLIELKGNIRVFCRIRPPVEYELNCAEKDIVVTLLNDYQISLSVQS